MTAIKERIDLATVGRMDWRGVKVEAGRQKANLEGQGADGGGGSGGGEAFEVHI